MVTMPAEIIPSHVLKNFPDAKFLTWLQFFPSHVDGETQEEKKQSAAEKFEEKKGEPPQVVFFDKYGNILAGPITGKRNSHREEIEMPQPKNYEQQALL